MRFGSVRRAAMHVQVAAMVAYMAAKGYRKAYRGGTPPRLTAEVLRKSFHASPLMGMVFGLSAEEEARGVAEMLGEGVDVDRRMVGVDYRHPAEESTAA